MFFISLDPTLTLINTANKTRLEYLLYILIYSLNVFFFLVVHTILNKNDYGGCHYKSILMFGNYYLLAHAYLFIVKILILTLSQK